jgi:hypothetical protein
MQLDIAFPKGFQNSGTIAAEDNQSQSTLNHWLRRNSTICLHANLSGSGPAAIGFYEAVNQPNNPFQLPDRG